MKQTILVFLITLFLTGRANSQNNKFTGNPTDDIQNFLEQESVMADIMDGIKANPKQTELTLKLQSAIKKNATWFQEYISQSEKGKALKYHPNFGISDSEYQEYLQLAKEIEIESSGKETLKIIKSDSTITFLGNGRLSIYNDVTFNLKKNLVIYKDYVLYFHNEIIVEDAENGLKSKWKGYAWSFENPTIKDNVDFSNPKNVNLILVKFTIGQLDKNGKTYMEIKEDKVVNGVRIIQEQLPIIL